MSAPSYVIKQLSSERLRSSNNYQDVNDIQDSAVIYMKALACTQAPAPFLLQCFVTTK